MSKEPESGEADNVPRGPALSVIIPAFQNQDQLDRCLHSVLGQTFHGEVVIIDDASSVPLSANYPKSANQSVALIRHDRNGGAAAARNTGIKAAKGPLISFIDSDDLMLPGTLEVRIANALASGVGRGNVTPIVSVCAWQEIDSDGNILKTRIPSLPTGPKDFQLGCWFCPGSTIIADKSALQNTAGAYDEKLRRLEDYDLFVRFALNGGEIAVDPTVGLAVTKTHHKNHVDVSAAVAQIRGKLKTNTERWAGVSARFVEAYLSYELAKLEYDQKHYWKAAILLGKSLIFRPRFRMYPGPGWTTL